MGRGSWEGAAYLGLGGLVLVGALLITLAVPRLRRSFGQNYLLFFGLKALNGLIGERRLLYWSAPALFALQLCELWPHLSDKSAHPELNVATDAPPVPEEIAAQLTSNTRYLIFMPPIKASCANKVWHGPYQNLAWFGAQNGLTTNANLGEARHSPEDALAVCHFTIEMYRHRKAHPEAIFIRP